MLFIVRVRRIIVAVEVRITEDYVVSDVNEERVFLFPLYSYMKCVCVFIVVEKNVQASGGVQIKWSNEMAFCVCPPYHVIW